MLPQLATAGVRLLKFAELDQTQRDRLDKFFRERAFPILTPMAVDPAHPSPRYHNRGLYLAAMLERRRGLGPKHLFAVVQVPQVLPRLVPLGPSDEQSQNYILLEEAVSSWLPELFGGFDVLTWTTFRITRDSDIELLEQESDDMLRLIEDRLKARQRGEAVRLEVSAAGGSEDLLAMIIDEEAVRDGVRLRGVQRSFLSNLGPLDLTAIMELTKLPNRAELRDLAVFAAAPPRNAPPWRRLVRPDRPPRHPVASSVRQFRSGGRFHQPRGKRPAGAGHQANALSHKRRFIARSPERRKLIQAAEAGKHVTAAGRAETARFDTEANNVSWARQMERAGVHVVFGFLDLKTHCKLSLVVRQEGSTLRRYVHLGTGNYNPNTALLYTDLGLFTANEDIAADASALFNLLTGYSQGHQWRKLVVAPTDLQRRTLQLIDEQTQRGPSRAARPESSPRRTPSSIIA